MGRVREVNLDDMGSAVSTPDELRDAKAYLAKHAPDLIEMLIVEDQ